MDFDEIQQIYKFFLEHLSFAHSVLYELNPAIRNFIQKNCQSKDCHKKTFDLDIDLLYLEKFFVDLDNILENIHNIKLLEMNFPEQKKARIYAFKKREKHNKK